MEMPVNGNKIYDTTERNTQYMKELEEANNRAIEQELMAEIENLKRRVESLEHKLLNRN